MTKRIILCPGGPFVMWWSSEDGEHRQKKVSPDALLKCWSWPVEVEGITLGELMRLVGGMSKGARATLEDLCDSNLEPFVAEMARDPGPSREDMDGAPITSIVVSKNVIFDRPGGERDGAEGLPEIRVEMSACGSSGTPDAPGERWMLEFRPCNQIAHAVVRVDPKVGVVGVSDGEGGGDGDGVTLADGTESFTLGEILIGVFDEVCFFGSPEARDKEWKSLLEAKAEIASGREKTTPWEQVSAKLDAERPAREAAEKAQLARLLDDRRRAGAGR